MFSHAEVPRTPKAECEGMHSQWQRIPAGRSITLFIPDPHLAKAGLGTLES